MYSALLCLLVSAAIAGASRHSDSSMSDPWNPEARPRSPIDQTLDACLSRIENQAIDVVIDIAFSRPFQPNKSKPKPNPAADEVADFLDSLGRYIPAKNLYAVIYDGKTRYYLTLTEDQQQALAIPAARAEDEWGHHHKERPVTIGTLVEQFFKHRATGPVQDVPTSKPPYAKPTAFTIVITDGSNQTPITWYPSAESALIIDLGGNFSLTTKGYRTRNVLLGRNPGCLEDLEDTVRLQICQMVGGIN